MFKQKFIVSFFSIFLTFNIIASEPFDLTETKDLFSNPANVKKTYDSASDVVVRVNGEDITYGDIQQQLSMIMQRYQGQIPPEQISQFEERAFEDIKQQFITLKLLNAVIKNDNLMPNSQEIDEALQIQLSSIQQNLPEDVDLETALGMQGISISDIRNQLEQQLSMMNLFASKTSEVKDVTEDEALEYYYNNSEKFETPEEVTASHILLAKDITQSEAYTNSVQKLSDIRTKIIAGELSFEEAALESSICPSKEGGGSLGTFRRGQMIKEFEDAAFEQEIGEIGDIIETQYGYHIIKVSDHKYPGKILFEDEKNSIIEFLTLVKKEEQFEVFTKNLRDSATIEEF